MTVQELIDKIEEIKAETKVSQYDIKEDLEKKLSKISQVCDNILIDWKLENAKCLNQMKLS